VRVILIVRRFVYRLWGRVPTWLQEEIIYRLAPKATLGVAAIIADADGRVLVVRHVYRDPPWGFPGGLVERREQPDAALARELREELRLDAMIGPLLHVDNATQRRHLSLYYQATVTGTPRYNAELDGHRYVEFSELPALLGEPLPPWLRDL